MNLRLAFETLNPGCRQLILSRDGVIRGIKLYFR